MSQNAVPPPIDWLDQDIPWHFGNPLNEQKLLIDGHGIVDISNRVVLSLTGPDRLTWLDSISSHSVANLASGESATTLILSPHGHIEHELHVISFDETCFLIAETGSADLLTEYLLKMRFMSQVEIKVETDYKVFFEPIREISDYPTWLTPLEFGELGLTKAGSSAGGDQSRYLLARPARFIGREVLIPITEVQSCLSGKEQTGSWAYNAIRIAAGVPRMLDFDHKTLPHEVGFIGPAVHLSKGCYRGQETVARLHNLGKPPRRLTLLFLEAGDNQLPVKGDLVVLEKENIGVICSSVQHFEFGPIALALIKRSASESETIEVNGQSATQQLIVNPESNRG